MHAFKYLDIQTNIGDNSYTVIMLLEMPDEEFDIIYQSYENNITTQMTELEKKPGSSFGVTAVTGMIDLMERICLDYVSWSKLECDKLNYFYFRF